MTKNTKTKILTGAVITALGMGVGYALYGLKKAKIAKMETEKEIPENLNKLADDYLESHGGYEGRHYIELELNEKEGKQK